MTTFFAGLVILIIGGIIYGNICEKMFKPDRRRTPAIRLEDGADYTPVKKWKNIIIQILSITGIGAVTGPVQAVLFGPVAFLIIPIGCVLMGAFYNYMTGMISARNNGEQVPKLMKKYLGKKIYLAFNAAVSVMLMLAGVVFLYTSGDLFVTEILGIENPAENSITWILYGVILLCYIAATFFPIKKVIANVYPIFAVIVLISIVGIFVGVLVKGYPLTELWDAGISGYHPEGYKLFPTFFITVACGMMSGLHSTQSTIISRTMESEKDGRAIFFNTMLIEGAVSMVWAAAAMGIMNAGLADSRTPAVEVIGIAAREYLGNIGGKAAIIGVILLPLTTGATALRSLRMIIADSMKIDQTEAKDRINITLGIFSVVIITLLFAKLAPQVFHKIWRYFAWANQVVSVFVFALITVYMIKHKKSYLMALIPGAFYVFAVTSFIFNAKIGFGLSWNASYGVGAIATLFYCMIVFWQSKNLCNYRNRRY